MRGKILPDVRAEDRRNTDFFLLLLKCMWDGGKGEISTVRVARVN